MPLTTRQKEFLRGLAHTLKPVVIIGQHGFTANVQNEIDQALLYHELIKVRVNAEDRVQRVQLIEAVVAETHSELVTRIGHIAVLYRPNPKKPKIELPHAKRQKISGDQNGQHQLKRKPGQNKRRTAESRRSGT